MSILDLYEKIYKKNIFASFIKRAWWWRDRYKSPEGNLVFAKGLQKLQQDEAKVKQFRNDPSKREELLDIYREYRRIDELHGLDDAPREVYEPTIYILSELGNMYGKDENFIREYAKVGIDLENILSEMENDMQMVWNSTSHAGAASAIENIKNNRAKFEELSDKFLEEAYKKYEMGGRGEPDFGIHEYGVSSDTIDEMQPRIRKVKEFIDAEIKPTEQNQLNTQDIDERFFDRNQNQVPTDRIQQPQPTIDFNYEDLGYRPDNRYGVPLDQMQTILPVDFRQ